MGIDWTRTVELTKQLMEQEPRTYKIPNHKPKEAIMPDWILNSKVLTIIAVILIVAAFIAFTLGYIGENVLLTILGFAGFGGMAAFRDWIDSQGYKTYVIAGIGILGTVGMITNFVTPDVFIAILTVFIGTGAVTLSHAAKKVPAGVQMLKTMKIAA